MLRRWWRQFSSRRAIAFNARMHARLEAENADAMRLLMTFGDEVAPVLRLSRISALAREDWDEVHRVDNLLFHAENPAAYSQPR